MEVKELRFGNYVSDYNASNSFYAPVNKITSNRVFYGSFNAHPKDIEPIELTEQWLLKFGFEVTYQNNAGKIYNMVTIGEIINDDTKIALYERGERRGQIYRLGNQIKYVHQLQNLYFALTGEELTIK